MSASISDNSVELEPTDTSESSAEPTRPPSVTITSITFSSGQTFELSENEIIAFVGPNNAGKSAALHDLELKIRKEDPTIVITDAKIRKQGTKEDFERYLIENGRKTGPLESYSFAGMGYNFRPQYLMNFERHDQFFKYVAPFFYSKNPTTERITGSNPAEAFALYQQPPSHPIHLLLEDNRLEDKLDALFQKAFGTNLIVFKAGGSEFPLLVGKRPAFKDGEDAFTKSFIDELRAATKPLREQGDGMRSFVTVMLNALLTTHHSVVFLDEPEAFLHPPQARLIGNFLSNERNATGQLFVSTHSHHVLEGLAAGAPDKVRIIRITRKGNTNYADELDQSVASNLANDPLARYSGVLEGIFYSHVIVTESDADSLFYQSILDTESVSGTTNPDVKFVHSSGKSRMKQIATLLRSINVETSCIVDIDILRDKTTLSDLIGTMGGDWKEIADYWRDLKKRLEEKRPPMLIGQLQTAIETIFSGAEQARPVDNRFLASIRTCLKSTSTWDQIKTAGRAGLTGASVKDFDKIAEYCASIGIWIVPVGEIEGFCRPEANLHGPAFVAEVLEKRDLNSDTELDEARQFMSKIYHRITT